MAGDQHAEVNMSLIAAIVAVATIGGFLFGFDSGVINGTIDGLQIAFGSDDVGTGFNVASMLLGCAVGAFAAGRLSDMIGRRSTLLISALLFIVSAFGSGIASSSSEFVIYRIIGGLAVGAASVLAPAYISEVTPARMRGRLSSVQQVMIIVGLTAAFLSNYLLADFAGGSTATAWLGYEAWRWMFWIELVPATIFLLALLAIPESPRFLVSKEQEAKAQSVLARLFGEGSAGDKVTQIKETISTDHKPSLSDLFDKSSGKIRTIVWVGIGLAVFQQLVGINVVFYYGAVLWQAVGFSETDALKINILSGSLSIISCLVAIGLIDRIGRKPLLLIGSAGMAITLATMAIAFMRPCDVGYAGRDVPQSIARIWPCGQRFFAMDCELRDHHDFPDYARHDWLDGRLWLLCAQRSDLRDLRLGHGERNQGHGIGRDDWLRDSSFASRFRRLN
jgi:SP family sugar:H+ symporter-like MFS transporter